MMERKAMRLDTIKLAAFLYLYLPVIIFCVTWFQWFISVPICTVMLFSLALFLLRSKTEPCKLTVWEWICGGLVLLIVFAWCYASGLGGFVLQSGDFPKHNVILRDLINYALPVRYDFSGREGMLSYYVAGYIVPALVGKAFGKDFDRAQDMLLIWSAIGIFLAVLLLYKAFRIRKGYAFLIIIFTIILFATFVCPVTAVFSKWFPEEAGDGVHWLSNTIWIQYSSNITMLSYVFPQMIPGLLAVAMFKNLRYDYDTWGLILAPLVIYSTFVFLGVTVIMLTTFVLDMVTAHMKAVPSGTWKGVKGVLSIYNISSLALAVTLLLYLLGNILQEKPTEAAMGLTLIDYSGHLHTLLFFELSWLLWIFLLAKREKGDHLLAAAAVSLTFYPFFKMGYYNDLCMRASIPALLIICVTVAENILRSFAGTDPGEIDTVPDKVKGSGKSVAVGQRDRWYAALLIICLMITGAAPMKELHYYYTARAKGERNYYDIYEKSEDFYFSYDFVEYQYIDWDPDSISHNMLR